jgi:hypothetical protein
MNYCTNPNCNKLFTPCPGSFGKYCCLSCGTAHRNFLTRQRKTIEYNESPRLCLQCSTPLLYDKRQNQFCSSSCGATYTNARKDFTTFKTGPKKGTKKPKLLTRIKPCVICKKYHPKKGSTCSTGCLSKLVSLNTRGKNGGNTDCNKPGVDSFGKKFFYDSNWEIAMAQSLDAAGIKWARPNKFILSDGRAYTPDFYIPEYDVYLDPKAKRPNYYRQSILKIELFEQEYQTRCLVITKPKLLEWYHIQTMLLVGTNRS